MEFTMDMEQAFEYASENTTLYRQRKNPLYTFGVTRLPYICLCDSLEEDGMVVVNRGEISAGPPRIALPGQPFRFEGFDDFEEEDLARILIARRVEMPPAEYVHRPEAAQSERGPLEAAVERTTEMLDDANDSRTALLSAPLKVWSLAVLMYVGNQIVRSTPSNLAQHLEHQRFRHGE